MIFSNEHAKRNYKVYTKQITKLLLYIVLQIRWQHTFLTTKHYTLSFPVTYLNFPNSINVKFINFDYLSRIPPPHESFSLYWILLYAEIFRSNFNANFLPVVYHYVSYLISHTCSNIYPTIKESNRSGEKPVGEYLKSQLDLVWIRSLIVWPAL